MPANNHFRYNAYDMNHFQDLLNASQVLKHYEQIGMRYFQDFQEFMFMIFLLAYKIVLTEPISKRQSVNDVLINHLQYLPEVQRLRLRTAGSKSMTYIAMKRLLDLILEKCSGTPWLSELAQTLASYNDNTPSNKNLIEMESSELVTLDSSDQGHTHSTFETWMHLLTPEKIPQILHHEEIRALDRLLHLSAQRPALDETLTGASNALLSEINLFTKDLLSELMKHEALEKYANLHDLIQETLKAPLKDKAQSPITEWVEALNKKMEALSDANENAPASENAPDDNSKEEHSDSKASSEDFSEKSPEETLEETLKETFEKRFSPLLNSQFLTATQQTTEKSDHHFLSDLEHESIDSQVVVSGHNDQTPSIQAIAFQKNTHSQSLQTALRTPDDLMLKIRTPLDHLKLSNGLHSILEDLDHFDDRIKILGIDHNSVNQMSYDAVIGLYKRVKTPTFIKFINQVGRQKIEAHKIQASKLKKRTVPIDKVGFSNNIDQLISDEYISLSLDIPAFENDFYDRYLNDALLTIKMIDKSAKHKGPIILCYDGSGSMEGVKIEETRMHILSIIEIAKIQKRALKLIQFASASEPLYLKELNPLRISAQDVLDILDTFICGGTDFEKPLSKAIDFIIKEPHKNSDILFITDGQCEIKAHFKTQFLALKKKHAFKLYTLIMHAYTYHDYGDIGDISDAILEINERHWNDRRLYTLL